MRSRTCLAALPVSALVAILAGCFNPAENQLGSIENTPIVSSSNGGVAITVLAHDYTFEQSFAGPAQGDSVSAGLVVNAYGGGTAQIEVVDAGNVRQWQLPVTGNLVEGQAQVMVHGQPPYTLHVQFTRFTGNFILGVGLGRS